MICVEIVLSFLPIIMKISDFSAILFLPYENFPKWLFNSFPCSAQSYPQKR